MPLANSMSGRELRHVKETESVARARFRRRVVAWSKKLGLQARIVRIQRMTRKWGSCSPAGTLTFALDLTTCPDSFQDIVIVHELLHLRVRNHGRVFRALMTAHVPNWRTVLPGLDQ